MEKIILGRAMREELAKIARMFKRGVFSWSLESGVRLKNPLVFVASLGGKIIGFCKFGESGKAKPEGFILRVEVLKEFQAKGVGRKLVKMAHAHFQRKGIDSVHTVADEGAIRFFRRAGYGVSALYGADGQGKKVASMSKPITKPKRKRVV